MGPLILKVRGGMATSKNEAIYTATHIMLGFRITLKGISQWAYGHEFYDGTIGS